MIKNEPDFRGETSKSGKIKLPHDPMDIFQKQEDDQLIDFLMRVQIPEEIHEILGFFELYTGLYPISSDVLFNLQNALQNYLYSKQTSVDIIHQIFKIIGNIGNTFDDIPPNFKLDFSLLFNFITRYIPDINAGLALSALLCNKHLPYKDIIDEKFTTMVLSLIQSGDSNAKTCGIKILHSLYSIFDSLIYIIRRDEGKVIPSSLPVLLENLILQSFQIAAAQHNAEWIESIQLLYKNSSIWKDKFLSSELRELFSHFFLPSENDADLLASIKFARFIICDLESPSLILSPLHIDTLLIFTAKIGITEAHNCSNLLWKNVLKIARKLYTENKDGLRTIIDGGLCQAMIQWNGKCPYQLWEAAIQFLSLTVFKEEKVIPILNELGFSDILIETLSRGITFNHFSLILALRKLIDISQKSDRVFLKKLAEKEELIESLDDFLAENIDTVYQETPNRNELGTNSENWINKKPQIIKSLCASILHVIMEINS